MLRVPGFGTVTVHVCMFNSPFGMQLCHYSGECVLFGFVVVVGLAAPHGMRDLSSPASDGTCAPCSGIAES